MGIAEDLSAVESNSVDHIVSADTIEHITDVYEAVGEMYGVLKPGGVMVMNTPNIAKKGFTDDRPLSFDIPKQ